MPTHATQLLLILVVITIITPKVQTDCRKTFAYHARYNYGYDIFCNHSSSLELSTTMANNAIFLTIINSNITFDSSTLRYLRKIRKLNITNSHIAFAPNTTIVKPTKTSSDESNITPINNHIIQSTLFNFDTLQSLEIIIVENTTINGDNLCLNGLQNLQALKLDNITVKNINFNNSEIQLNKLQILTLRNNGIRKIEDVSLCNYGITNLRKLYLDNNKITNLGSDLKCLKTLEILSLSHNSLDKIDLESTTLINLNLSANSINSIENFKASSLRILDLSENYLQNVKISEFENLQNLTTLNLNKNKLSSISLPNTQLTNLDLSHNDLSNIPKLNLPQLKSLKICFNNINEIQHLDLNFSDLVTFEATNNSLAKVGSKTFTNLMNISNIDLSSNRLSNISLQFLSNNSVTKLNLSHNNLDTLPEVLLTNLTKLKHFDVSYNRIKSLNDSTFKPLESLEVLNMSHNLLTQLDYKLLEPLENLIVLDVDNNMIQELDYGTIVSELINLEQFKTKNNLLTCELLTKMIHYFKDNNIVFSLNEHLDYDKENVEGIYCIETRNKLEDLRRAEEALVNNTKILNALYEKYHDADASSYSVTGGEIVASLLSLVSLVVVLTLAAQRVLLWHRRRNYLVDELELMTKEPYKRFG